MEGDVFLQEDKTMGHKSIISNHISNQGCGVPQCVPQGEAGRRQYQFGDETSLGQRRKEKGEGGSKGDGELICACMHKQSQNLNKHVRESPVSHH